MALSRETMSTTFCSRSFDTELSTRPTMRNVAALPTRPSVTSMVRPAGSFRFPRAMRRRGGILEKFLPQYKRKWDDRAKRGWTVALASRLLELWSDTADDEKLRKRRPAVKTTELVYGVDARPPPFVLWIAALQHVLIATTVGLFFPLLVLEAAHASRETSQHVTSVCH